MSDTECDLDELTAMLEEEDNKDDDDGHHDINNTLEKSEKDVDVKRCPENKSNKNKDADERTFEELSVMLGKSDDEDDVSVCTDDKDFNKNEDFNEEEDTVIDDKSKVANDGKGEDEFDDFYDSDMEEMMQSMENQSELEEDVIGDNRSECKSGDRKLLEGSERSQAVENTDLNEDHDGKGSKELSSNLQDLEVGNHAKMDMKNQSDLDSSETSHEWLEKFESQNQVTEEGTSEMEETDGTVSEEPTVSTEYILAEMKLMSERMEQLKAMLEERQSTVGSSISMATISKSSVAKETRTNKNKTNSSETEKACRSEKKRESAANRTRNDSLQTKKFESPTNYGKIPVELKSVRKETRKESGVVKTFKSAIPSQKSPENLKSVAVENNSRKRKREDIAEKDTCTKFSDLNNQDEENPFFAATPSNEDSGSLADPRSLFGDSDDSDWEELDGEKKSNLSDEGRQMKKLLNKGPRQRVAHTPKYDPAILKKSPPVRWTSHSASPGQKKFKTKPVVNNPQVNPETGTVSGKYTLREEYKTKPVTPHLSDVEEKDVATDPYCGIKIINPRISMSEFKSMMSGRNMIKVSHIHHKVGRGDLQKDNWVTMGVVVHRTEPRQSAAGKSFCIWKLSDLLDCDKTVSFFLFGNVYKEHWKNNLGTVIGLLNPNMMDKAEKAQSDLAFTVNHPQQLLVMGVSKDLGRCKGTTKAGNPCSHFINKSQGEYCTYHVQAAYKKSSAKRTELQASTGITPKAFTNKGKGSKDSCFFYGGQTYTTMKPQAKSSKDQVTLKKLQHAEANKGPVKVTTMSLHELEPEDVKNFKKLEEKDAALLEKLMVPTAGSMNLVKHIVKKDKPHQTDASKPNQPPIESVSAKDLLKQHQNLMKQKMADRKKSDPLAARPTLGKGFSVGQEISLDVPVKKSSKASVELAKNVAIAKLKEKGGVKKEDPNAVKKKLMSPEQKEKIKKRVAEDIETTSKETDADSSEPPKKRSKFLGNVDLNDPEVQKLLKSKSKHKGALAEAEAEHEAKYFMALEKKEKMEEKMDSVREVEVKLFKCKQCKYKAYSLLDSCKRENHVYKVIQAMKRFFKCKKCKKRTETTDKFPTEACKECGGSSFERVSMLKERSGPKLESEELSLRGNEQKYLGSLNQKSYLNL